MKTFKPVAFIAVAALAGNLAAPPARADDASCKPVTDSAVKMAHTPYHEVGTNDGKPYEAIYTTTTKSIRVNDGKWMTVPLTPQEVLDNMRETIAYTNCRMLRTETVDGQPTTVYATRILTPSMKSITNDSQIWLRADGLVVKSVSDVEVNGRKRHAEMRFTYDNVQAPPDSH